MHGSLCALALLVLHLQSLYEKRLLLPFLTTPAIVSKTSAKLVVETRLRRLLLRPLASLTAA